MWSAAKESNLAGRIHSPVTRHLVLPLFGSPCWIRTNIDGFKVRRPTVRREGNEPDERNRRGCIWWRLRDSNSYSALCRSARFPFTHKPPFGGAGEIRTPTAEAGGLQPPGLPLSNNSNVVGGAPTFAFLSVCATDRVCRIAPHHHCASTIAVAESCSCSTEYRLIISGCFRRVTAPDRATYQGV
jgi:hypothetical protein